MQDISIAELIFWISKVCERCSSKCFTLRCNAFVQLLHILHLSQQSHMIFIYLVRIVELNERISTSQKLQKSTHYRNSCEAWKIMLLSNLCSSCFALLAMSAKQQCDFHHNSMRTRSIFDIFDSLSSAHFVLQNESSIVCFTYWVQMLLRCEIDEIAKRMRNHWDSDFDAKISQSYQIWL